jgi:threonine aldolase
MFAKDGAVFFLTASMANLASVLYHSRAGTEIIISSSSHSIER